MSGRMAIARAVLAGEDDDLPAAETAVVTRRMIIASIVVANVIGAVIVVLLLDLILPLPKEAQHRAGISAVGAGNTITTVIFLVVAVGAGTVIGLRRARPVIGLFVADRTPDEADRRAVLRLPLVLLQVQLALWGLAVLVFGGIALRVSALYAFEVAITIALAGIPTASLAYLLTQRLLRLGISRVLVDAPPRIREVPGVQPRALLAWALGVVPIGGVLTMVGVAPFTGATRGQIVRSTIVLCSVGAVVGLLATLALARAVADPLQQLRDAFEHVENDDLDVQVPVFDATEVGYATAGFNRMVAGLRERERLRDLFGRQVGSDVAQRALEQGVTLGGEERFAAALFVDVMGSTSFAAERGPTEVVTALNEFFEAVVGATQQHGGLVNKFIGDAALCVFGAPLAQDDPCAAALAAARDMAERLRGGVLDAGIGVAAGTVVAGNVGTSERYEYTVIGDPVNEAARITDLAKHRDGRVLASATAVEAAGPDEAARWDIVDEVTVRGRSVPTRLAAPLARDHEAAAEPEPGSEVAASGMPGGG